MSNLKNLLEIYINQYPNGYKDKHALRYIYKRCPDLWADILSVTSFLPETALPKQRCWHILHNIYEIPKCPVTNEEVRWFENRYLTYISLKAKSNSPVVRKKMCDTYKKRTGHTWSSSPKTKMKRSKTFIKNNSFISVRDQKTFDENYRKTRAIQGFIEKYGVDNPMKVPEFVEKLKDPDTEEKQRYYADVQRCTKHSWVRYYSKINPNNHKRGVTHVLDHIYSRYEGWKNNIPAEIIGHWTNLQMLSEKENRLKNADCWKNKEELIEDYNKYIKES